MRKTIICAAVLAWSSLGYAHEPWVDPDPEDPPKRYEIGDVGVKADLEYRAQYTFVDPIALNSETNRRFNMLEHRARVGTTIDYDEKVSIRVSLDLLDGVLWGDNGTFGSNPSSDSGIQLSSRNPNVTRPCVGYLGKGDQLQAKSYGWTLCEAAPVKIRRLYGQVNTPIGVIRVGRQAVSFGAGSQNASGDGRTNRWGIAYSGDNADRILFATKPLEAFKDADKRDVSEDHGLILALVYDRIVSDTAEIFSDDVQQMATALRFLEPDFGDVTDIELLAFFNHRWNSQYNSTVNTFGARASLKIGDFHVGFDAVGNVGATEEVSRAYQVITNDPAISQQILQFGGRAVVRYDHEYFTAYLEAAYASGDGEPSAGTPLTQFNFSPANNMGLLMFERVMQFQSARAAAAGTEIVRRLGAETFPTERINTRGAFTNAFAIFPQIDFHPHKTVMIRTGALVAWAPEKVIDTVASLQAKDGVEIEDDLINFVGGSPGQFYGVEFDARAQWKLFDHFALDIEGAVLIPGNAFFDVNGQAVTSFMGQGRTTFYF